MLENQEIVVVRRTEQVPLNSGNPAYQRVEAENESIVFKYLHESVESEAALPGQAVGKHRVKTHDEGK